MTARIYDLNPMYYVYFLIDPRNNMPFYVGKGKDQRATRHLEETREEAENIFKYNKIQKIRDLGLEVVVDIYITKSKYLLYHDQNCPPNN